MLSSLSEVRTNDSQVWVCLGGVVIIREEDIWFNFSKKDEPVSEQFIIQTMNQEVSSDSASSL